MGEFKSTSQFIVTCKVADSAPVVERCELNSFERDYLDLYLNNDPSRSHNVDDYDVKYGRTKPNIIRLDGNVLTVELI